MGSVSLARPINPEEIPGPGVWVKKALIIEASLDDAAGFVAALKQDYRVLTAATVRQGLQIIQLEKPDMVIWGVDLSKEDEALIAQTLSFQAA